MRLYGVVSDDMSETQCFHDMKSGRVFDEVTGSRSFHIEYGQARASVVLHDARGGRKMARDGRISGSPYDALRITFPKEGTKEQILSATFLPGFEKTLGRRDVRRACNPSDCECIDDPLPDKLCAYGTVFASQKTSPVEIVGSRVEHRILVERYTGQLPDGRLFAETSISPNSIRRYKIRGAINSGSLFGVCLDPNNLGGSASAYGVVDSFEVYDNRVLKYQSSGNILSLHAQEKDQEDGLAWFQINVVDGFHPVNIYCKFNIGHYFGKFKISKFISIEC